MTAPPLSSRLKSAAIRNLGGPMLTGLLRSTRSELIAGHDTEREVTHANVTAVYVLWHGRLLPCAFHYRDHGFATLISQNRDGDHISSVVQGWGYHIIRGSSSRGGTGALRQIVRTLRSGISVAMTPDGPRGPARKMKLGPLIAAQLAGVPLVPVAAGATRAMYFGRWDRFLIPAPRTRVTVALGDPSWLDPESGKEELLEEANRLEKELDQLTTLVDYTARVDRR